MSDIAVENYKKSVTRITDRWNTKNEKIGKELAPLLAELAKLNDIKSPGPDEKTKIAELEKKRDELEKQAETAKEEMRIDLMLIEPPVNADQKELVKLPGWLESIIKAKGIPLGKAVSIAPDVKYDFKKNKLTHVGVTIHFP